MTSIDELLMVLETYLSRHHRARNVEVTNDTGSGKTEIHLLWDDDEVVLSATEY